MRKLVLMSLMVATTIFSFAQEVRYIEIEGSAKKTVEPDMIIAELNFYSYSYDYGSSKDEQKFESMVMKLQEKLDVDKYAIDPEDLNSACEASYEKYIDLEFDNYADYARMEELVYDLSTDDLYVDLYLDDYRVSEELREKAFDDLLGDAIDDAIRKADLVAEKFNIEIGDPILFIEHADYYDDYYYDDYYYDDYYYDYDEGVELEKSVSIQFEIK